MAAIPVLTAISVAPTNEQEITSRSFLPAATIAQGQVCLWDANRKLVLTGGTAPVVQTAIAGIALRSDRQGGQAITLLQRGFLSGYNLTGRALYDTVFAGINGTLDTAGAVKIGRILPFNAAGDLGIWIDIEFTWAAIVGP